MCPSWWGADPGEMDALLSRGFHRCVDATHPYAVQATREIGAACARAGVPLRRLLRPEGGEEGLRVDSPEEAARLLAGREGNILLATGAKELPAFAALEPARLFPRVLPSEGERGRLPPGGHPLPEHHRPLRTLHPAPE